MRLSAASINIEELNKYSSAKEFIDTLKKSREFVADVYINHHLAFTSAVHFAEMRNYLIAYINGHFAFSKMINVTNLNIKIHRSGDSVISVQSATNVSDCLEIGDQDADLYVAIINTHPHSMNRKHVPESRFHMMGTSRLLQIDLDSQPSDDSSEGGDTWNPNWVDLGITDERGNKILFSDRNLGANSPEDSGNFYCIGEPYYKDNFPGRGYLRIAHDFGKYEVKYNDISITEDGSSVSQLPEVCRSWYNPTADYSKNTAVVEVISKGAFSFVEENGKQKGTVNNEYDVAYINSNGKYTLPTAEYLTLLWNNTEHSLIVKNDKYYARFEGNGKFIIIPLVGIKSGDSSYASGDPEQRYNGQIGCGLITKDGLEADSLNDDTYVRCIIHGFFIDDETSTNVQSRDEDIPGGFHTFTHASCGLSVRPVKVVQSQSSDQESQDNTINWNETGTYISTSGESGIELNYMLAIPDSLEASANVNRMILRKSGDSLVAEMFTSSDEDSDPSFTAEMPLNSLQDGNVISGTIISDMMLTKPVDKTDRKVSDYISLSGNIDVRDIESNPYIAVKVKSNGEWQWKNATCATGTYTNKAGMVITFTANEPGEEANNYRLVSEGWSAYTDGSIDEDYGIDFRYTPNTHFILTPVSLWGGTIKLIDKRTDDLVGQDSSISYLQNGDGYEDVHAARCMALAVVNQESLVQKDNKWYSGDAFFDMGSSGDLETSPFYGNILNYITFDVNELDLYVDDLDYGAYDDDEYHLDVTFSGGSSAHYEWVESNNNG